MTTNTPARVVALVLVSACVLALPAATRAALVAPGETVQLRSRDFLLPEGQVLAEAATPFFLVLEAEAYGTPVATAGTLTSTVIRERATGRLTFAYAIDFAGQGEDGAGGATSRSKLSVTGFTSALTDVAGKLAFEDGFLGSRSRDGRTVTVESDTPGEGGPPTLLVRTDADDFDAGGVLNFAAADPFLLPDSLETSGAARGMMSVVASGETQMSGVFRPAGRPSAVPLPPGVIMGAGTLIACTLAIWRSRRGQARAL